MENDENPLMGTLARFSQESALHSLHIFSSPIRKWRVRLIWTGLLLCSVGFGVYMSYKELKKFFWEQPTVTEVKMNVNRYLHLPQVPSKRATQLRTFLKFLSSLKHMTLLNWTWQKLTIRRFPTFETCSLFWKRLQKPVVRFW